MATHEGLSGLLDELRAGGELDSRGQFTLDRAQARAKMQKFQLDDPRRYVLELVQAAVLRGATAVSFEIDADDMRMRCDGQAFTAAELEELWGSIFADGDDRPLRGLKQLALGLNAALGLDPKRIVVRSGDQELRLVPGRDDALTTLTQTSATTTIHVEQRLRLGLVVAFFRDLRGRLGEEIHLRQRCAHAPITISLDGKPLVRGLHIDGAILEHAFAATDLQGVIGLTESGAPAELRLIKDGVWIDSQPLPQCGRGIVAIVEAELLRKDVSMAKIVVDEALRGIIGQVYSARWSLLAALAATGQALPRVREEALTFLKLRHLRKVPPAQAVAAAVTWPDARTHSSAGQPPRQISLAELAETVAKTASETDERVLRCAVGKDGYAALVAEGPPIPRVDSGDLSALKRVLACRICEVDSELEYANRREIARRAWHKRTMAPGLPGDRRDLCRASFRGPQIRGELAINPDKLGTWARPEGTLWLIADGCLLAEQPLAWGIAGLDVAVEAAFKPTEMFDDVVHDETLVAVVLQVLAGLLVPLADLVASTRGSALEADVRGLVKSWLLLVLDEETRQVLWERLAVPAPLRPDVEAVRAIVPGAAGLLAGVAELEGLLLVPIFEDFDGTRRSLAELRRRLALVGHLDEVSRGTAPEPGLGSEVLWLGPGDRKIVAALLGADALRSWEPTLARKRRERWFWAKPVRTIAELTRQLRTELMTTGRDPALWLHTLAIDGIEAALVLSPPMETRDKKPTEAQIELLVGGRAVVTRRFELGFGAIRGVATSPSLGVAHSFEDVVDDAALSALAAALQAAAWALVTKQARSSANPMADPALKWWRTQLLERLAKDGREALLRHAPELAKLPLVATLDRGALSLEEVDAIIAAHGVIEWVPTSTPGAALSDPPMVREGPDLIAALRGWCGEARVTEGGPRLLAYRRERQFGDLPTITEIKLRPADVWLTEPVTGGTPPLVGEIGLSRRRSEDGLRLELCSGGRRIGTFTEPNVPAPVEAILADEEVILDAHGLVDTKCKRYAQYLRRCRRAVSRLIADLCARFPEMAAKEQRAARELLLNYAAELRGRGNGENKGSAAVRLLPLFVDVWGEPHTLDEVERQAKAHGMVEVVTCPVEVPKGMSPLDRLIVVVDPPALRCLEASLAVINLDNSWARELAALHALATAPPCELPDLDEVAWVDRKATIAGGLQAHLWIPRTPGAADVVRFAQGGREVGRVAAIPGAPCAGIVTGAMTAGGELELDLRQRQSLAKQVCMLYEALAKQVKNGRLEADEAARARAWLAEVEPAFGAGGDAILAGLGKPLWRVVATLGELMPPALRDKRAATRATPTPPPAREPAPPRAAAIREATPEQRLLSAVRGELEWARTRHGTLLERLKLSSLAIGTGKEPGLARFDAGLVMQQRHPLVTRLLAQLAAGSAPDPIDLAFVVANVYTVMNEVAEEIGADDEQAFVAKLAQGLALGLEPR